MAPVEKVFPYVSYHGRYYPIIPVIIRGRERTIIYALVDSGASISLFPTSVADDAGIDLEDTDQAYLAGIGGYVKAFIKKGVRVSIEELGRYRSQSRLQSTLSQIWQYWAAKASSKRSK